MSRRAFWLLALGLVGCRRRRHGAGDGGGAVAPAAFQDDHAPTQSIPSPPTLVLVTLGALALALCRRRAGS